MIAVDRLALALTVLAAAVLLYGGSLLAQVCAEPTLSELRHGCGHHGGVGSVSRPSALGRGLVVCRDGRKLWWFG